MNNPLLSFVTQFRPLAGGIFHVDAGGHYLFFRKDTKPCPTLFVVFRKVKQAGKEIFFGKPVCTYKKSRAE